MKNREEEKEYRTYYKAGDLVKVSFSENPWYKVEEEEQEGIGLVICRTNSWYEAYKDFIRSSDPDKQIRYWDNVNYAPYKVLMCKTHEFEWVSPEHMKLIS